MRKIAIVTTSRADYHLNVPILGALRNYPAVKVGFYVTGMHLSPDFGLTVRAIEQDGFDIFARIESLLSSDTASGTAISMGLTTQAFSSTLRADPPDLMLVLGDRFEMFATAAAAVPFGIPIAHVHGGELSYGAMDDTFRHCLTKMSHLHFVSTEPYAQRVIQLGEEPWRVVVSGAPGLDYLRSAPAFSAAQLAERFSLVLDPAPLLVTLHPETRADLPAVEQARRLLEALAGIDRPIVFTMSNADPGGRAIMSEIRSFVATHRAMLIDNMGIDAYQSTLCVAAAMVGNSSSGIIEAASLGLPVVNIGGRQDGRIRARNVIDVSWNTRRISDGIATALSSEFRRNLADLVNPYGDGKAAERIASRLASVSLDSKLLRKRFYDLPPSDGCRCVA